MSLDVSKTGLRGFRPGLTQSGLYSHKKMARTLKFRIWKAEGLYYPSGENKGADQLRGYRKADLRLCFRICKNPVFSRRGSNIPKQLSPWFTCTDTCIDTFALLNLVTVTKSRPFRMFFFFFFFFSFFFFFFFSFFFLFLFCEKVISKWLG